MNKKNIMKYVEMVLTVEDASIIKFPFIVEKVKAWANNGIKFVRVVTDAIRPDYIIHFSGSFNNPLKNNKVSFNELYDNIKDHNSQNLTILKALYSHVEPNIILNILNIPLTSNNKYIKELLQESNGYLIYKHQLEQFVIDKLYITKEASTKLRRDWNKKSIKNRELLIQSDHYFLIENKMPQYFVFDKPTFEII
jgi:hypothetical protein